MSAASLHLLGLNISLVWVHMYIISGWPPHSTFKTSTLESPWSESTFPVFEAATFLSACAAQKWTWLFCGFYRESGCHVIQRRVQNSLNPDTRVLLFICLEWSLCITDTFQKSEANTFFSLPGLPLQYINYPHLPTSFSFRFLKTESSIPHRKCLVILPLLIHV